MIEPERGRENKWFPVEEGSEEFTPSIGNRGFPKSDSD
jgi:hypothetical protein